MSHTSVSVRKVAVASQRCACAPFGGPSHRNGPAAVRSVLLPPPLPALPFAAREAPEIAAFRRERML